MKDKDVLDAYSSFDPAKASGPALDKLKAMSTLCNCISCQCDRTVPPECEPSSQHTTMSKDKIRPMDVKVENPKNLSLATAGENPKPSPAITISPLAVVALMDELEADEVTA